MQDYNATIQQSKVNANLDLIKFHCYTKLCNDTLVLKGYDLYIEIGKAIGLTEEQCRAKHLVDGGTLENYLKTKINFYFTELKLNGLIEALGDAYWTMSDEGKQAKDAMQLEKLLEKKKNKKLKLTKEEIKKQYGIFCIEIWRPFHSKYMGEVGISDTAKYKIANTISKDRETIVRSMLNGDDMNEVLNGYYKGFPI